MTKQRKINQVNYILKISFFLFLIFLSLSFTSELKGENQDFPDRLNCYFFRHLTSNAQDLLSSPLRWNRGNLLAASLASAATLAFLPVDQSIHLWVSDPAAGTGGETTRAFSAIFHPAIMCGFVSAGYLAGELSDNSSTRQAFLLAGESLLLTEMFVQALKTGLGRARPYLEEGAFSFRPINFREKRRSFPSGHAASAWAVAASLAASSKSHSIDALIYTLAAGASLSRVLLDKHFASDVLAGSLLGFFIGKKISQSLKPPSSRLNLNLLPADGGIAITINYSY
jgi:membrane-associated phospholipid phosphatase